MTQVYTHKTDLMRRVLHYASHGYTYWTAGEIAPAKAEALALKLADRYGTGRTETQRYRAKGRGEANTMLLMLHDPKDRDSPVYWWLMTTPGTGLVHELEELADIRRKRANLTGYELLVLSRKRREKDKPDKASKPTWTWVMTQETFDGWKSRIQTAVRQDNEKLIQQMLHSLGKVPGFRGVRVQAYLLYRIARADWKRARKGELPYPAPVVRYCGRYRKAGVVAVAEVSRKARRQKRQKMPVS